MTTHPISISEDAHHAVQFYADEAFLAARVAAYLKDGLDAGEPCVVIATQDHRAMFAARLRMIGVDVDAVVEAGHLRMLDAETTLGALSKEEGPDWKAFLGTVGEVVRGARASHGEKPVRAYGEMVDLLWRRGAREEAIALEEMWNQLGTRERIKLLCAYGMSGFQPANDDGRVRICRVHTHQLEDEPARTRELEAEVARRRELERTLRAREQELSDFLDTAMEGIHFVAEDGTILYANRAELEMLGYTREEYIGRNISDVHCDRNVLEEMLAKLTKNEAIANREVRLRCKDGSVRDVLVSSNALFRNGKFVHTRCFTRDVTLQKRAYEDVQAANRAKDEFLAVVSHELRTPLNAILGWSRMLRDEHMPTATRTRALDTIERNARAQNQLIEDLLDVSRIVSGKLRIDMEPFDLRNVVERAVDAATPQATAKGIDVRVTMPEILPPLVGDGLRLQQCVANLLNNAIKFSEQGRAIDVTVRASDSDVEIDVRDEGRGIGADFLPYVFERFRQGDGRPSRAAGGLGLGLAIVKNLVELHGGRVTVRSDGVERGATFTIHLDTSRDRRTLRAVKPIVEPRRAPVSLAGLRVLVVDDEEDARQLVSAVLAPCDVRVRVAASASEALAALEREPFDAVVSDIGMPGEDGYAMIASIRARPTLGRMPVIALTAFARSEERAKILAAGFDTHLSKPVEPDELIAVVSSVVRASFAGV